ncbi:hypothetical protein KP77_20260 [Jeotgalibacillus alimentarius]|uniref:Competence protein ComK n=1 Tax=Jeotgalibacillus alimentarius TaxID=135826 RepID=A0A0C2RF38_9BACL|nr:hypothetical protein [Jeotgalibacillus alimentarius]KIL48815.1 hypothetical protein KP77_20260 [Jeotgalibacillus alimentarius]
MFNERAALKIRLEQMEDSEIRILQEFRNEREKILQRLRELDQSEASENASPETGAQQPKPTNTGKSKKMHAAAIEVLKKKLEPVKGTDIQSYVEEATGFRIANITTFMKTIQRHFPQVRKLDRGLYIYEKE